MLQSSLDSIGTPFSPNRRGWGMSIMLKGFVVTFFKKYFMLFLQFFFLKIILSLDEKSD